MESVRSSPRRLVVDVELPASGGGGAQTLRVPYSAELTVTALGEKVRERAAAAGAPMPEGPLRLCAASGALLFDSDLLCDVLVVEDGKVPLVRVSAAPAPGPHWPAA